MKPIRIVGLAVLAGCIGGGGATLPRPSSNLPLRTIAETRIYTGTLEWRRTPWYRSEDLHIELPVMLLVAEDGTACIVTGSIWAVAQPGQRWSCLGRWRFPRP